jgi:hypothetical protein
VTIAVKTMNTQIPHQRAVLYLAVDECSQLRIGKMYKRHSTLSALDFVQVLVDAFPFRIRHLQTPLDNVFTSSTKPRKGSHAFTHNLRHLGIIHLVPSQKAARIKQIIERVRKVDQESFLLQTYPSAEEAQNEIRKYLLRWNNERKIAPDENLAPVEKLRSFDQFEDFGLFDPKID